MTFREEIIGDARLILGDCREVMASWPSCFRVDAVVTDPPYSARTHVGHDAVSQRRRDGANGRQLGYAALDEVSAVELAARFDRLCGGWVVWLTDSELAGSIRRAFDDLGRTTFAPLPYHHPGRSVRLSGDGPSSWTDWIVVARTKAQLRWGTLPGGYVAGPGWNDKERMGGKPTALMNALIADYTKPNETVVDPFMGSGTTGVACALGGRRFIGIEIDGAAFDIACRRIDEAYKQPRLLAEPIPKPTQLALLEPSA